MKSKKTTSLNNHFYLIITINKFFFLLVTKTDIARLVAVFCTSGNDCSPSASSPYDVRDSSEEHGYRSERPIADVETPKSKITGNWLALITNDIVPNNATHKQVCVD